MKRIIILLFIALGGMLCAQTYDTISGKDGVLPQYYYPEGWFDTCILYYETGDTPERWPNDPEVWGSYRVMTDLACEVNPSSYVYRFTAYEHHVDEPVAFTGVSVMMYSGEEYHKNLYAAYGRIVTQESFDSLLWLDTVFLDTVYILCPDTSGELAVVASVSTRWDTATRKVWKFPTNVDSAVYGFKYVYLYDLKFDHPVVVDSLYYIYGTHYNGTGFTPDGLHDYFYCRPWFHAVVRGYNVIPIDSSEIDPVCNPYKDDCYIARMDNDKLEFDQLCDPGSCCDWWGPYLLMIDSATIEVESADLAMGTAGPTRSMSKWVTQTITATPEYGYRFSHWNDGNTDNPRDIYLTQDTHFTAYFEPMPRYMVVTDCVPEGKGMVLGGGEYWCDDTVTLTAARPIAPYVFHQWNDGNRDNPRRFVIGQDTAFTAYFARQSVGIDTVAEDGTSFTLTPNPTTGKVTVELHLAQPLCNNGTDMGEPQITVRDAAGHKVLHRTVSAAQTAVELDLSHLATGTYFVTLTTPNSSTTRRLVVN